MRAYRYTRAAASDIVDILAWSEEQFGVAARVRYGALLIEATRDAARRGAAVDRLDGRIGEGAFLWKLAQSRRRSTGGMVRRPRHVLVCREIDGVLVIGRVLHESMDLARHVDDDTWSD